MAARSEVEKIHIRRTDRKDEDGRSIAVTKTEAVPPEQWHPRLRAERAIWLWKYIGTPQQLAMEEPESDVEQDRIHLSWEFDEFLDPFLKDKHIKFVNVNSSVLAKEGLQYARKK